MERKSKSVDFVLPVYNEGAGVRAFYEALSSELAATPGYAWRLIFVDDGSRDDTLQVLSSIGSVDSRVVVVSFSRNFGHQAAVSAGIDLAEADGLIMMDTDLQHPPALVKSFLALWSEGADVVSAVRKKTEGATWFKKTTSALYYRFLNRFSDTPIVPGVADFGLLSRRAYEAVRICPERHRFIRGMVAWVGFRRVFVEYEAGPRAFGISKYTMVRMINFALDGLISFSTRPLRVFAGFGLMSVLLGGCYLMYAVIGYFFFNDVVNGWASVICTLLISTGFLTILLVVISEYIGKVFEQVKGRPLYIVASRSDQPRVDG